MNCTPQGSASEEAEEVSCCPEGKIPTLQLFRATNWITMPGKADLQRESIKYSLKRKRRLLGFVTSGKCPFKIRRKGWRRTKPVQHTGWKPQHQQQHLLNLICSQVLGLDHRASSPGSQPKTPCWPYIGSWARPRTPEGPLLGSSIAFIITVDGRSWKAASSKIWA